MIFAVSKYLDQVKTPPKKKYSFGVEAHHYFDTEQDANAFIIRRAFERVTKAEKALASADKRYQHCLKKYGAEKS